MRSLFFRLSYLRTIHLQQLILTDKNAGIFVAYAAEVFGLRIHFDKWMIEFILDFGFAQVDLIYQFNIVIQILHSTRKSVMIWQKIGVKRRQFL